MIETLVVGLCIAFALGLAGVWVAIEALSTARVANERLDEHEDNDHVPG
jgi:hypothetical protein